MTNALRPVTELKLGDQVFLGGGNFSPVVELKKTGGLYMVVTEGGTKFGPMTGSYVVEVAE